MSRSIPTMILGAMAAGAVSMSSGILLASYVTAGMLPASSTPPTLARSEPRIVMPTFDDYPPAYGAAATEAASAD